MKWHNPGLIYAPVDESGFPDDPPIAIADVLWDMPAKVGRELMAILMEAYGEEQRRLDDIGWIMHELDGLD